jgi:3'-phosphoadenosine 5'-phosphosulfate sulfotransferase (PAPS reductase)/FAD synthetase
VSPPVHALPSDYETPKTVMTKRLPNHLEQLEAESIYIIRELVAQCAKPVMLY